MLSDDVLLTCVVSLGSWLAYVPESPLQVASIPEGSTFLVPLHR